MRVSRMVLKRNGQQAILRGMIHVCSDAFYQEVQEELNWAQSNGYHIFLEHIMAGASEITVTKNEQRIRRLLLFFMNEVQQLAAGRSPDLSLQKNSLVYPEDAIWADANLTDLVRRLHRNGYKCNTLLLWVFETSLKRMLWRQTKKPSRKEKTRGSVINVVERWLFDKTRSWLFLRHFTIIATILTTYRNEVAVAKIKRYTGERNILVHYGENHTEGIAALLQQDGWLLIETSSKEIALSF